MELEQLKTELKSISMVGFDTETKGLKDKTLVGFSIAYKKEDQIIAEYYPVAHKYIKNVDQTKAKVFLKWLFEKSEITIIMHNAVFDLEVLVKMEIKIDETPIEDTMILSHLLDERYKHGLKECVLQEFAYSMLHFKDVCGSGQKAITFDEVQDNGVIQKYASEDAYYTLKLFEIYIERLKENEKLTNIYNNIEIRLVKVVVDMHTQGIKVDIKKVKEIEEYCQRQVDFAKSKLDILMPGVNLNSSKQLAEYFISQKGLQPLRLSPKTGAPAVDKEFFERYEGHYKVKAEISAILRYRKYNKLLSTFVPALIPENGNDCIYPKFRQVGTISGRFSSSEPNAQNIPRGEDSDRVKIREAFIPREGYILIDADYSQIELRVAAVLSQDPLLLDAYKNDKDIHEITAKVCGCTRQHAKTLNFGLLYGIRERSLAKHLKVTEKVAYQYWEKYWKTYKTLFNFIRDEENKAIKTGELYTHFGRRRLLSSRYYKMKEYEQHAHLRSLVNSTIQGTSADIMKKAMLHMYPLLKNYNAKILLTVHDEVLVEAPWKDSGTCFDIIKYAMIKATEDMGLKFTVGIDYGNNWEQAKNGKGDKLKDKLPVSGWREPRC